MKVFTQDPLESVHQSNDFYDDFRACPLEIFKEDPEQLLRVQKSSIELLCKDHSFFQHGDARVFLIFEKEKALGRLVASVDRNLVSKKKIGHFGFFECVQDVKVSTRLFEAATEWLKEQGCQQIEGPINLSVYYKYRFQIDGFEREPFLSEPRNPSYYPELCEQAGFKLYRKWHSYEMGLEEVEKLYQGLLKTLEMKTEPDWIQSLSIQYLDKENFESQMRFMRPVVLDIFSQNYGFSNLSEKEFIEISSPLFDVIRSDQHLKCLDENGELLGFGYAFDDYFPFFKGVASGERGIETLKDFDCDRVIMHTFGVSTAFQRKGISEFILCHFLEKLLKRDVDSVIGALCVEKLRIFQPFSRASRSYGIFKREIS